MWLLPIATVALFALVIYAGRRHDNRVRAVELPRIDYTLANLPPRKDTTDHRLDGYS